LAPTDAAFATSPLRFSGPKSVAYRAPRSLRFLYVLKQRWVVERGFAHLHSFRRLRIRYERWLRVPHRSLCSLFNPLLTHLKSL
jgi:transposase